MKKNDAFNFLFCSSLMSHDMEGSKDNEDQEIGSL